LFWEPIATTHDGSVLGTPCYCPGPEVTSLCFGSSLRSRLLRRPDVTSLCFGHTVFLLLVYACDQLPNSAEHRAYIVNLDDSAKPGSHWVAVWFIPDRREVFYYDSYGLKPENIHIIRFVKRNSMFKKYNDKIFQSHCAATCGQHCLYFLWHCVRGYPPSHVLSHFKEKKRTENDQRVTVFVNRNFTLTHRPPFYDAECVQQSLSLETRALLV